MRGIVPRRIVFARQEFRVKDSLWGLRPSLVVNINSEDKFVGTVDHTLHDIRSPCFDEDMLDGRGL